MTDPKSPSLWKVQARRYAPKRRPGKKRFCRRKTWKPCRPKKFGGYSTGLRLVQMLAKQMRGTVETGPGPGAEFQINFNVKGLSS